MVSRIKQLRLEAGMNQSEFGEKIGVSRDTVANIEGKRIPVRDIHIKAICKTFGINEEWLKTGEGEMKAPVTKEDEIAEIAADLFHIGSDSFRYQMVKLFAKMSDEQLELFRQAVHTIAEFTEDK